jgi:transposase-like protein
MKNELGKLPESLQEAVLYFSDPEKAHKFATALRWPEGVTCPRCGSKEHSYISTRRIWFCKGCKKQFTVKVGSIFEDSPLGMDKWMLAVWLIVSCKNGISSYEVARHLKITQKSAWHLMHRIRLAMQDGSFTKFSGEVEADESYIGGRSEFMHLDRRTRLKMAGKLDRGGYGKAIVLGLLDRNTRKARVKVIDTNRKTELRGAVRENVEPGSTVYTDALKSYRGLPLDGFAHDFIDHAEAYVKGAVHTNGLENFWSLLKRSLKGTYISVEPFHLQAYADEQAFRFNNRENTDLERFVEAMSNVSGKQLTWDEVTGKQPSGKTWEN